MIKKIGHHVAGIASGIGLLILTSFVPPLFYQVMEKVNSGATLGVIGSVVMGYLAFLGAALYVFGHIFNAYNKKVAKDFESWFK